MVARRTAGIGASETPGPELGNVRNGGLNSRSVECRKRALALAGVPAPHRRGEPAPTVETLPGRNRTMFNSAYGLYPEIPR
jgi:hypothetical protein